MAIIFDGFTQYVRRDSTVNNPPIESWTMMAWVKFDTAGFNDCIFSLGASGTTDYRCTVSLSGEFLITNGSTLGTGSVITTDQWYHAALVCQGTAVGDLMLYIDGELDITDNGSTFPDNDLMTFGVRANNAGFFDGSMDCIKVYNVALTQEQIQKERFSRKPVRTNDLNYFNDTLLSTTLDQSVNANDLTATGSPTLGDGAPLGNPQSRLLFFPATGPSNITGNITSALDDISSDLTGIVAAPVVGNLVSTLQDVSSDLDGEINIDGSIDSTVGNIESSLEGDIILSGDLSSTLNDIQSSLEGSVEISGNIVSGVDDISSDLDGIQEIVGDISSTLENVDSTLAGEVEISGDLSSTLDNISSSLDGTIDITGDINSTLSSVTSDLDGEISINGDLSSTLEDVESNLLGIVSSAAIIGVLGSTLEDVSSDLNGIVNIDGNISSVLDGISSDLEGTIDIQGSLDSSLEDIQSDLNGSVEVLGSLNSSLENILSDLVGLTSLRIEVGSPILSEEEVFTPVISIDQQVSAPTIPSGETVLNPIIMAGSLIIEPPVIDSEENVYSPDVNVALLGNFITIPAGNGINSTTDILVDNVDVQPGYDRISVICCVEETSPNPFADVSSVQVGGQSATLLDITEQVSSGGTFSNRVSTYVLLEDDFPSDGSNPLVVIWDSGALNFFRKVYYWQFDRVDQTTPVVLTSGIDEDSVTDIQIPYAEVSTDRYITCSSEGTGNSPSIVPSGFVEQNNTAVFGSAAFWGGSAIGPDSSPAQYQYSGSNRLAGVVLQLLPTSNQFIDPDHIGSLEEIFPPEVNLPPLVLTALTKIFNKKL